MSLHIDQIRRDGGTQSRAAINEATVAEYAEAMADPDTVFPPVIVYFDGREYWLADGFHRLDAWQRIGRTDIPVEIRQGDRRRAILHSVAANSAHGLRRTNDDKRRAVLTLLEDAEWSQWSDREIARQCAVTHPFVAKVRREMTGDGGNDYHPNDDLEPNASAVCTANIGTTADNRQGSPAETSGAPEESPHLPPGQHDPAVPPAEPEDPVTAKARRELALMTPAALIDEIIGLRAALAESKANTRRVTAERDDLKQRLADHTADDKDEVIRRMSAAVKNAENAKWRATEEQGRQQREIYALKKRIEELQSMGVAI